jgi:hypothetical protein
VTGLLPTTDRRAYTEAAIEYGVSLLLPADLYSKHPQEEATDDTPDIP